jgi:hypothetical protein
MFIVTLQVKLAYTGANAKGYSWGASANALINGSVAQVRLVHFNLSFCGNVCSFYCFVRQRADQRVRCAGKDCVAF